MIKRKSSAFESMFKSKVLEEKAKPTRERKILFPHKYDDNAQETDSNYVIDIGAYREVFERIDNNGDGYIDVEEFGIFLRSIGLNPTDEEVLDLFCKMDKDGSRMIEFDEFINILDHPMIKLTKNDIKFSIESSFRKFFPTNDIRVTDLKDILTKMGKMRLTEEEFEDLITKVTSKTSESGIIDYRQIVELFVKDYEKVNIINNDNDDDSDSDPASDDEVDHLEMPSNKY